MSFREMLTQMERMCYFPLLNLLLCYPDRTTCIDNLY